MPLQVEVELTCALPPWISGTLIKDAVEQFHDGFAGAYISPRYEQLCTSRGTVRVGRRGDDVHRAPACASTVRARRDTGGFWGHAWPSALFPSDTASVRWRSPSGGSTHVQRGFRRSATAR